MNIEDERTYQSDVKERLLTLYSEVETQWLPLRGQGRIVYSPAVDVAVGPFATERRCEREYDQLLERTKDFIQSLVDAHNTNVQEEKASFQSVFRFNRNARCLMAIEIEASGSKKHCLGNLINVSSLGRVGLLIARNEAVARTFLRQRVYLDFLRSRGKNTYRTDNALVLTEEQFDGCLGNI